LLQSQDTLEQQERKRLDALRQRDQERAKRFVNAKSRSIGIDKEYLDKQVEEKRLRELAEKEERLAEGTCFTALQFVAK
jgi:trehalose-6-phosphate synthase